MRRTYNSSHNNRTIWSLMLESSWPWHGRLTLAFKHVCWGQKIDYRLRSVSYPNGYCDDVWVIVRIKRKSTFKSSSKRVKKKVITCQRKLKKTDPIIAKGYSTITREWLLERDVDLNDQFVFRDRDEERFCAVVPIARSIANIWRSLWRRILATRSALRVVCIIYLHYRPNCWRKQFHARNNAVSGSIQYYRCCCKNNS